MLLNIFVRIFPLYTLCFLFR